MISESKKQPRILIVDDDEALLLLFSMALECSDYHNDCASGGEEALKMLSENTYDLVLLDLQMPGVNGLEVLSRMRKRGDLTRVVIVSAFVPGSAVLRAVSLGVTTFLGKPVTIQFLRDTVSEMLDREVRTDFDLARKHAANLNFEAAHQVLAEKKDTEEVKKSLWAELFRALAEKGGRDALRRLEGPSERLVTFQF